MEDKPVRITARMFESEREYLRSRGVTAREIIRAWIIQDKYNKNIKKELIVEKENRVSEIENFIDILILSKTKHQKEIDTLKKDFKKVNKREKNLTIVKRKIISKWNNKKNIYDEGHGVFVPISLDYVKTLCREYSILFNDIITLLPKELLNEGLEGYGKYKNYTSK